MPRTSVKKVVGRKSIKRTKKINKEEKEEEKISKSPSKKSERKKSVSTSKINLRKRERHLRSATKSNEKQKISTIKKHKIRTKINNKNSKEKEKDKDNISEIKQCKRGSKRKSKSKSKSKQKKEEKENGEVEILRSEKAEEKELEEVEESDEEEDEEEEESNNMEIEDDNDEKEEKGKKEEKKHKDNKKEEEKEQNKKENEEEIKKVKSIQHLKNTINSKSDKYTKISKGIIPKKFEFHENYSKTTEPDNEKEEKEKGKEKGKKSQRNSSNNKNTKKKKKTPQKLKESSSADAESFTSSDPSYNNKTDNNLYFDFRNSNSLESKRISQEVEEVIKRIESKKKDKQKELKTLSRKKRKRSPDKNDHHISPRGGNHTAEEFNYILQKNPNIKNITPYINLEELSNNSLIKYTDILLAIMEIGQNSNSYLFAYSSKSKMFWNDVLQYNILKKIFSEFKSETLRKYWNELSKYDAKTTFELIKKNKEYLDRLPSMRLGTIISTISKILTGKISDFKDNQKNNNIQNKENYEQEYQDAHGGALTKIKKVKTVYNNINNKINLRKKYEPYSKKDFNENNINLIGLQEVYHKNKNLNDYQYTMEQLFEDDKNKMSYAKDIKRDRRSSLNKITQQDKFIFKSIDMVLEGLSKEFSNYSKEYILDILKQNSMNIAKTYICLKEPMKSKIIGYTPLDDKIILKMKKGEEFNNLLREKGKKSILEREEYLSN